MYRGMKSGSWVPVAAMLFAAAAAFLPATAAAADSPLDREGTVGLSAYGDYATLTGQSRLGLDFKSGGGYGLSIRYTLNPHWSLGLGFRNQTYNAVNDVKNTGVNKLVSTEVIGETYYYRDRNANASQYVVLGAGFYRPEIHREDKDILFPGENLVVSAGLGVEVFMRENWGLDLSVRGFGYLGEGIADQERTDPVNPVTAQGSFALGLQGQVGIIYYLTR